MSGELKDNPKIVGVRIPSWARHAHGIYEGILEYMQRCSHVPWRLEIEIDTDNELPSPDLGKDWRGDGIITFRYTNEEAASWRRHGIAAVNISTEKASTPLPSVFLNNQEAGRQAARFFLEHGWSRFGYLHDPHRRYSTERLDGFRDVLGEQGYEVEVVEVGSSAFSAEKRSVGIRAELEKGVGSLSPPVAILGKDDILATALLHYLPQFGFRCPEDVAVIGVCNDRLLCQTSFPSCSSVRYPAHRIGFEAASLLGRQLAGETVKASLEMALAPCGVRERESSVRVTSSDELITDALGFIRREAPRRAVRVEELWEGVSISRESFRKRFLAVTGMSPKKEIDRVRVEAAKNLLSETAWPVAEVAEHMGFGTSEEFSRFFRRAVDQAPTEYRSEVAQPGVSDSS